MTDNGLRALVGTAPAKIGTFLFEFATPGIGQILKAAGADFAVLDMEHTGFGFDTVRQVVRYMQAANLPLVVRVPSQSRHHISRALDTGADGVMVPIVSSVEQARAVLDAAKYWPDGTRGVALGLALAVVVSRIGIDMPPPPGADVGFVGRIATSGGMVMLAAAVGLVAPVLASLWPALRVSRVPVVEALRAAQ